MSTQEKPEEQPEKKKAGRPRKYSSLEEKYAAKREQDKKHAEKWKGKKYRCELCDVECNATAKYKHMRTKFHKRLSVVNQKNE